MITRMHFAHLLFPAAMCLACTGPEAGTSPSDRSSPATEEVKPGKDAASPTKNTPTPNVARDGLGGFEASAPLAYGKLLRKTPDQVDAILGTPSKEGGGRISCVRFVPHRVRFSCTHTRRDYVHPKFAQVSVHFEDGLSSAVEVEGFVDGDGQFDVDTAMKLAGVRAALPPRAQPTEGAEVWVWFNHEARIKVDGSQYLLRLSSIDREWKRSKLEIIYNNPLSEAETSRVTSASPSPGTKAGTPSEGVDPNSPSEKKKILR